MVVSCGYGMYSSVVIIRLNNNRVVLKEGGKLNIMQWCSAAFIFSVGTE